MTTQYELNPKDYKVEKANITRASIEDIYNSKYIALQLECTSGITVDYPAINLIDLTNLNAGVESLLQIFEVSELRQVIHRNVYLIRDSRPRADVFALFNPENNQFFSLQAKFFPESYDDSLKTILENKPDLNISHLDKTEGLLVAVVASLSTENEYCERMQKAVNSHLLYNTLLNKTEFKNNAEENTFKKKI